LRCCRPHQQSTCLGRTGRRFVSWMGKERQFVGAGSLQVGHPLDFQGTITLQLSADQLGDFRQAPRGAHEGPFFAFLLLLFFFRGSGGVLIEDAKNLGSHIIHAFGKNQCTWSRDLGFDKNHIVFVFGNLGEGLVDVLG